MECRGGQFHGRVTDRLSKEVIGCDRAGNRFAGKVIGFVRRDLDFEFGKDIAFHFDCALRARWPRQGANLVTAEVQFGRENKISRRDPEAGGLAGLLEDLVALRIADFKGDHFLRERLFRAPAEDQAANMNRLTGLINRLVCGEKNSGGMSDFHLLDDTITTERGRGLHDQLIFSRRDFRNVD